MSSDQSHDLQALFSTQDCDYLIRNNGHQVKVESLKEKKKIGLYFSASWCGPCQEFTPALIEVYNELASKGEFEVVYISADEDDESFQSYFSKMPWLAVPFSQSEKRDQLDELFKVRGIPHLVILDEFGGVLTANGVEIVQKYGAECYPFTPGRINELKEQEEEERRNQSLKSILRCDPVSWDGLKVPVSDLEGNTVGLYFASSSYKACTDFTPKLVEVYKILKAQGEKFEVVLISLDDDEEGFQQSFGSMPWLALPFNHKRRGQLVWYFDLSALPTLIIIGPDGKTLHSNVAEAIEEHGVQAYPFTPEKFAELEEIQKAKEAAQTLESVLVSGDRDFVIGKDGAKIPVSDLVGKNILLYFSAHWCPPCRAFLPKLIQAYNEIKAKDNAFEVIFISSDRDEESFNDFFSGMPWLALPFGDERKGSLSHTFKVSGIPMLVALGPSGRTVTKEARELIMLHGADAYPFTEERLKELEAKYEEKTKGWPKKVNHDLHKEHELVLTRRMIYICDSCEEEGKTWSYNCDDCDFDLHPKCALGEGKETQDEGGNEVPEGWVCDGEVCYKA